jgi:hypothetical protein
MVYVVVGLLGAAWPVRAVAYESGSVLAGIDNLILPLAVIVLVEVWLTTAADASRLLRIACGVLVLAMCINAILGVISTFVDLTPLLSQFWSNEVVDPSTGTVAGLSAQLGRATGILNQPAEAGTLYSMALLAAIYILRDNPSRLAAAVLLILVGGVITVSKVFLLVGLPIAAWQVLRIASDRKRRVATIAGALLVFAIGAGQAGLIDQWEGSRFLGRLLEPNAGLLEFYTGQRLGESSSVEPIVESVLRESPVVGMGAGGLLVPYDNGWVEAFATGGVIGVIVYTFTLAILMRAWWIRRSSLPHGQSMLGIGLVLLAIGASVGFSPLTANRVATVLWVLVTLALLAPDPVGRMSNTILDAGRIEGPKPVHRHGTLHP